MLIQQENVSNLDVNFNDKPYTEAAHHLKSDGNSTHMAAPDEIGGELTVSNHYDESLFEHSVATASVARTHEDDYRVHTPNTLQNMLNSGAKKHLNAATSH